MAPNLEPVAVSDEHAYEKDLSTEQDQAQAPLWFSRAHGDQGGAEGLEGEARQGPQALERLRGTRDEPGATFPRACRLRTKADFGAVFRSSIRRSDEQVRVLALHNGLRRARLGLSLPRREIRHAVDRNRLKRLARESFRYWKTRLSGWDIVVIARRSASQSSNARFLISLERSWRGLGAVSGSRSSLGDGPCDSSL
jgi:ribonuclease P protein component